MNFECKCNVFKATVQGALLSVLCAVAGHGGSFTEHELFPLEACQNKLRKLLAEKRKKNKRQIEIKELHRKLGLVPIALELGLRRGGQRGWRSRYRMEISLISKSWQPFSAKQDWTGIQV